MSKAFIYFIFVGLIERSTKLLYYIRRQNIIWAKMVLVLVDKKLYFSVLNNIINKTCLKIAGTL